MCQARSDCRVGCVPVARLMASSRAPSEARTTSTLRPSATLILLCRWPSDSRIWARLRRSASACSSIAARTPAGAAAHPPPVKRQFEEGTKAEQPGAPHESFKVLATSGQQRSHSGRAPVMSRISYRMHCKPQAFAASLWPQTAHSDCHLQLGVRQPAVRNKTACGRTGWTSRCCGSARLSPRKSCRG